MSKNIMATKKLGITNKIEELSADPRVQFRIIALHCTNITEAIAPLCYFSIKEYNIIHEFHTFKDGQTQVI